MKKTYIQTDEKFDQALQKLKDNNPGFSGSLLIRMAVLQMAATDGRVSFVNIDSNTNEGINRKKKSLPKDNWCEMFGGSVKDGVCTINKYETISTGHVRKNIRAIALTALPENIDDFKKDVLGHYESVEEAEAAYQAKPLT